NIKTGSVTPPPEGPPEAVPAIQNGSEGTPLSAVKANRNDSDVKSPTSVPAASPFLFENCFILG
ncbi:MAG: hypothetical protein K2N21_01005, partial [Rikenellaceae bacterium]|nr:hypothetical protein [Rikenellaceae bacterium]